MGYTRTEHAPPLKLRPYGGIDICVLLLLLLLHSASLDGSVIAQPRLIIRPVAMFAPFWIFGE